MYICTYTIYITLLGFNLNLMETLGSVFGTEKDERMYLHFRLDMLTSGYVRSNISFFHCILYPMHGMMLELQVRGGHIIRRNIDISFFLFCYQLPLFPLLRCRRLHYLIHFCINSIEGVLVCV